MKASRHPKEIIGEAMRLATAGRFDEAVRTLESEGKVALNHSVGRNLLGSIYLEEGKLDRALKAFERAARIAPTFAEAHCNRGVVLHKLGRHEQALASFDKALGLRREYPLAHFNRGNVLQALGRLDEAIEAFSEAVRRKPDFAEAHLNRGWGRLWSGRLGAALIDADRALALLPASKEAGILKANVLAELGRMDEALAVLDDLPASDLSDVEALLIRSTILMKGERYEDALAAAVAAIDRRAGYVPAHIARARALWKLERREEALAAADAAVEIDPNEAEGYAVRGVVLGDLQRHDEQMAALDTAARLAPNDARRFHARAVALGRAGKMAEAQEAYEAALRLAPDDPLIHHHAAMLRLHLGDIEGGFAEHEWRLKTKRFRGVELRFRGLARQWEGEDPAGKSLLVHSEQGLGDVIQFARYVPLIVEKGAKVRLVVPRPLRTLFESSLPDVRVDTELPKDDGADATGDLARKLAGGFDFEISLLSLAHVFKTIPSDVPYLLADPARIDKWRQRIGDGGFRIGIVWQGKPSYASDRFRSVALAGFAPLAAIGGVRLISLQAIHGLDQLDTSGVAVESFGDEIARNPEGIAEIAAAMASLDLVVTIDSAVAHLAGALARPVWVMLRRQPEWRWMQGRHDTPWYPTMRLFRQKEPLVWDDVFAEMAGEVEGLVAAKS